MRIELELRSEIRVELLEEAAKIKALGIHAEKTMIMELIEIGQNSDETVKT